MEAAAAAARSVLKNLSLSLHIDPTPGYVAGVGWGCSNKAMHSSIIILPFLKYKVYMIS